MHQDDVMAKVVDAAFDFVKQGIDPNERPPLLFHFTTIDALIAIVRSQTLWASDATALNDPSEIAYTVQLADDLLSQDDLGGYRDFCDHVRYYLDPDNSPPQAQFRWRAFVTSFCEHAENALHWLHYGHSGTGVAVALDSNLVVHSPFELVQVTYDPDEQRRFMAALVETAINRFEELEVGAAKDPSNYNFRAAAHVTAQAVRASAPRFKAPAFAAEQEWRLVSHDVGGLDLSGAPGHINQVIHHRAVGSRLVAYLENRFAALPVSRLILGWSCGTATNDPSLRALIGGVPVSRSAIPLRP